MPSAGPPSNIYSRQIPMFRRGPKTVGPRGQQMATETARRPGTSNARPPTLHLGSTTLGAAAAGRDLGGAAAQPNPAVDGASSEAGGAPRSGAPNPTAATREPPPAARVGHKPDS